MLVCVSTLIVERSRFNSIFFLNTVDQQAALRWVQKHVSLVLLVEIRDRKIILPLVFSDQQIRRRPE